MTMIMTNLVLALLLQTQVLSPKVVVGLEDGQQLVLENPSFMGFIQGAGFDAVLMYRQKNFHGEMPLSKISRIEFGRYKRGQPFVMAVTLRNGEKLEVSSDHRDYVMVKGDTGAGEVTIKHPDPITAQVRLSERKPNRGKDLTILYLEFPAL